MLYGFSQVILQGALVTLELALSSVVLAVLIGLAGAGAKLSSNRPLALVFEGYTTLIRGVPDLVLMLLIFYGLQIALNSVTDALGMAQFDIDPMIAGIITLGFIYGAYFTETFRGAIVLDEKPPAFVPSGSTAPNVPNKKKDTLQSIIDKVNERFKGHFTDADRVIIEGIYQMFMKDPEVVKFRKYARDNSTEMFVQSLFPDKFSKIVTQCYMDNNDSFIKLFNDPDFYQKVQEAMAQELYRALRKE